MRDRNTSLKKLARGDRVAILSPSSGLAGLFPWVLDYGLDRLENIFGLVPIEFPTTRMKNASPEERASDINDAFQNSDIKAIITTIGGDDQIKVLKYIDQNILSKNPKPFFGFSDNTNLAQLLYRLNIPSYYGGAIMPQFAMQNDMHKITIDSLNNALFNVGEFQINQSKEFTDTDLDWAIESNLTKTRAMEKNDGWHWDGKGTVEGTLWGGCVETLLAQLSTNIFLPESELLKNLVIFLETAEDIPEHWIIECVINSLGERDILKNTQAVLIGRPKAWQLEKQFSKEEKTRYKLAQQEIVKKSVRYYNKEALIVQNMDFGHTDPQVIIPMGNKARIDSITKKIYFTY
ncbi:MAG: S66 peptidase family protein [Patescibacteria group bacterium]